MTEQQLQQQCFKWFHNYYPLFRGLLFHVQNNAVNKIQGNHRKSLGVISGVSDFIALTPTGTYIAIELKTESGKQSKAQKEWQSKIETYNGKYYICKTLEQFQEVIKKHFD